MLEDELLAELPSLFPAGAPGVATGSGPDDCAHLVLDGRRLALSVDAFAEGSHFLADAAADDVAAKALGASLSDLAASACRARWALVSLCLRRGVRPGWAGDFARGMADAARRFGVAVVGGDTVAAAGATVVSVTVAGEPLPGGPLLRSGGRPGDVLVVTGRLGGSILGRHLRPEPRLREIGRLMDFCARSGGPFPSAAMDVSDGFALDLSRLCRESGVGAVVREDLLPVAPEARELSRSTGRSPLEHALADGEDFELLVAMPPGLWSAFERGPAGRASAEGEAELAPFTRIGELTREPGLLLASVDGAVRPLAPEGYRHQW